MVPLEATGGLVELLARHLPPVLNLFGRSRSLTGVHILGI